MKVLEGKSGGEADDADYYIIRFPGKFQEFFSSSIMIPHFSLL